MARSIILILGLVAPWVGHGGYLADAVVGHGRRSAIRITRVGEPFERIKDERCRPAPAIVAGDPVAQGIVRGHFRRRVRIGSLGQTSHCVVLITCLASQLVNGYALLSNRIVLNLGRWTVRIGRSSDAIQPVVLVARDEGFPTGRRRAGLGLGESISVRVVGVSYDVSERV